MRRNGIRSFITRSGQVIRAREDEIGTETRAPRQPRPRAEGGARTPARRRPAQQAQRRPPRAAPVAAGLAAFLERVDMRRLAATILLAVVGVFAVTLAVAGIWELAEWISSGDGDRTAEVLGSEGARGDMEVADSQKPVTRGRSFSSQDTGSRADDGSHDMWANEGSQPASRMRTYRRRRQEQETPAVSAEPAVDYQASIREMEDALEARATEIRKVIEDIRSIGRSGESDQ